MTDKALRIYEEIQEGFSGIAATHHLDTDNITIKSRGLTPEEAIGITKRRDYPILTGAEIMLQAEYQGAYGQAFTDAPADFEGTLKQVMDMDIIHDPHARGLYFAAMNAALRCLGLIDHTVHCRTEEPVECAAEYIPCLKERFPRANVALIGYQPSLFEALSAEPSFKLRVLDLNPGNVGETRFGVKIGHGIRDYEDTVLNWADLVLCTSSVFCNATMDRYIDIGKPVLFFGITGAAAIYLLGLDRHCPKSS